MNLVSSPRRILLAWLIFMVLINASKSSDQSQNENRGGTTPEAVGRNASVPPDSVYIVPFDSPADPIGGYEGIQMRVIYPHRAHEAGIEGKIIVQAFVNTEGVVTSVKTTMQSGKNDASLKRAAEDAVKKTKFKPAIYQDKPVGVWTSIPITFKLIDDNTEGVVEESKAPPSLPDKGPTVRFIPYDAAPEPIGGYGAIQKKVVYPPSALQAGIGGTVIVQAFVSDNGHVTEMLILKGVPNTGLDAAAMEAIQQIKFKPASQAGKPVGVWISIPVNFGTRLADRPVIRESRTQTERIVPLVMVIIGLLLLL